MRVVREPMLGERRVGVFWVMLSALLSCNSDSASRGHETTAAVATKNVLVKLAATPGPASEAAESHALDSFESYWAQFRAAVQGDDKERLADLAKYPFETRGASDDDPVLKLNRAQLIRDLDSLLKMHSGSLDHTETQKQCVARTTQLAERDYAADHDAARVGNFVFIRHAGRWWFTRAYTDEE